MKKLKITLVMALVAICGCFQANAGSPFRFGVKAGLNVDKFHFSEKDLKNDFDGDNRCGWTAGVMTEFTVPIVGIGMDLSVMYTRMNSEAQITGSDGLLHSEKTGKNFLEIPLNVKYKINIPAVSRFVVPMIYTGPTLALKLGGSKNNFLATKSAQWGWNVGLGVELIRHLQVSAGYTFGINNIVKITDKTGILPDWWPGVEDNVKLKNNYWTITAAWLF